MNWLSQIYEEPPEMSDTQGQDPDFDIDPPDPLPEFPTLTDCPLCGSSDSETCGCFDKTSLHSAPGGCHECQNTEPSAPPR